MSNLNELIEEMAPVINWLGVDTGNLEELHEIAKAFAWIPIQCDRDSDDYTLALFWMKDWGERVLHYFSGYIEWGPHYSRRLLQEGSDFAT